MFFKKKNINIEENVAKQGIKKMDHVVTGLLLGGIIASIYGVKKYRERDDESIHTDKEEHSVPVGKTEKKQSIISRIFFGNK